jgi:hypothetical protein
MTRRQAAAWRRVSVSTVQYWVDRRRQASPEQLASGSWAKDRPSTPKRQPRLTSECDHERVCAARRRTGWARACSPPSSRCPMRPSLAASSGAGCRAGRSGPRRKCGALSGPVRATCCRWTPSASRASAPRGTRSPGIVTGRGRSDASASATSLPTRSSTTTRGWPTRSSTETNAARLSPASSPGRSPSSSLTGSSQSGCRPTTPGATARTGRSPSCSGRAASSTAGSRPAPPSATARSSATSRRSSAMGLRQRYRSSQHRALALPHWLQQYNTTRRHSAIGNRPPISRVRNVSRQDS